MVTGVSILIAGDRQSIGDVGACGSQIFCPSSPPKDHLPTVAIGSTAAVSMKFTVRML